MCWPEAVGASLRLLMWLNLSGQQELRILSQLEHWSQKPSPFAGLMERGSGL